MPRILHTVSLSAAALAVAATPLACRTRAYNAPAESKDASAASCASPVSLAGKLAPTQSCYDIAGREFDTVYDLAAKRKLTPWIPCNEVELVSMASKAEFDFEGATRWVAAKPRFEMAQIDDALAKPGVRRPELADHPAFDSPNHEAMVGLIRGAKKSIFFNAIIFGGAWGSELVREMVKRKREAGVEVLILRDTQNVFAFARELNPVWEKLVAHGVSTDGFTVLRSDINSRMQSGIPFGGDRVTSLFSRFAKEGISVSGRSDHTKVLIVDGFTPEPSMFVTSKNPSDYNLLNYDESAIVRGPAAAAAQAAFLPDLALAEALAVKESRERKKDLLSAEDKGLLARWRAEGARVGDASEKGLRFTPRGASEVRLSENNGDDSVRNTEHAVLQLIAGARKNLRVYNFLTYNPMVAKAVADAVLRLGAGNVKVMGDATLTYALNVTFAPMVRGELKKAGKESLVDSVVKWRLTMAPITFPKSEGRIDMTQQQHTKSIIVDDEVLYLGSTNFDFATLGGAFRELSVSLRDQASARASASIFDRLWNDPSETVGTARLLETGGPTKAKAPSAALQQAIIGLIDSEQARVGALNPRNIVEPEACN